MDNSLRNIFDEVCRDLVVDPYLVKRIAKYKNGFIEKNEEHIAFFGGNLLGTETVRHTPADRDTFFEDIMGIDEHDTRRAILTSPLITADFKRLSDPYNLTALYLVYRLNVSNKLPERMKQQAMLDVVYMLQVKLFTSILSHWFKHRAQVDEAKATYAEMTKRFGIKEAGSWNQWFINRSIDFLDPNTGLHRQVFKTFAPDDKVCYAVTEPQDRLRATMKKFSKVFQEVRKKGSRIKSVSGTLEIDGELMVKSLTTASRRYLDYIKSVIGDKNTFIREEVLNVVTDAVHTAPERLLLQLLTFASDNYGKGKAVPVEPLVDELILHAIEFVNQNQILIKRTDDLGLLVTRLKALYGTSKMRDIGLIKAKECADRIVMRARVSKNSGTNAALRTALELYIVLRTLSMNYYR